MLNANNKTYLFGYKDTKSWIKNYSLSVRIFSLIERIYSYSVKIYSHDERIVKDTTKKDFIPGRNPFYIVVDYRKET